MTSIWKCAWGTVNGVIVQLVVTEWEGDVVRNEIPPLFPVMDGTRETSSKSP